MDIPQLVNAQREYFLSQRTKPYAFRMEKLRSLAGWIKAHESDICAALYADLGKCEAEAYMTEVYMALEEAKYTMKHLKRWMKPLRARAALGQLPGRCRVISEPYGVTLIMSPWNYPFQLTVAPLIGALSAGCCAVVKPSSYSPATSELIRRMVGELFDEGHVAVVCGGREQNAALLEQKFDFIFFTGGAAVGRLVMEKTSAHLCPVSLELGGKSPVIVDETADIALTARRLAWGKYLNAGQTCVAPDYVLVHRSRERELTDALGAQIRAQYGGDPLGSDDYPKIINQKHFERLSALIKDGDIAHGGGTDAASRRIAPTVITNVSPDSPVMRDEIFGPILPILAYDNLDEAIKSIQARPKPLALYLFTRSRAVEEKVLGEVSFGGGCVNDCVMHLTTPNMPFGGVGESGMGGYHGKYSFEAFSHRKSVLKSSGKIDVPLRYRPYGNKLKLIKKL